ncbi:MAG: hypothetical protein U1E21_01235 [Reyranellaceae bacterium]
MAREKANRHSIRVGLLEPGDYGKPLGALAQDIAAFVRAQGGGSRGGGPGRHTATATLEATQGGGSRGGGPGSGSPGGEEDDGGDWRRT